MKMMLDECILDNDIQEALRASSSFDACTTFDLGFIPTEPDENLVAGTVTHGRVLLTKDKKTITAKRYPPCDHGGIVQIRKNECDSDYVLKRLDALRFLGLEDKVVGHFTYVYFDKIKVVTHNETIEEHFKDHAELQHIIEQ